MSVPGKGGAPKLADGQRTVPRTVKLPESTDLLLRQLAVQDNRHVGALLRDAIELYLSSRGAELDAGAP